MSTAKPASKGAQELEVLLSELKQVGRSSGEVYAPVVVNEAAAGASSTPAGMGGGLLFIVEDRTDLIFEKEDELEAKQQK